MVKLETIDISAAALNDKSGYDESITSDIVNTWMKENGVEDNQIITLSTNPLDNLITMWYRI